MMWVQVVCPECGCPEVSDVPGVEGVLQCDECDEFFEDDDIDLPVTMRRNRRDDDDDEY